MTPSTQEPVSNNYSIKLTNSPNVGDAPHAIKVSSADIIIDVFEQPMLVICHPNKKIKNQTNINKEKKLLKTILKLPAKSCTGFGYIFASPVFLFCPNKNKTPISVMAKLYVAPQNTLRTPRADESKYLIIRGTISSFGSAWPRRPNPPKPQLYARFFESIAT